MKIYVVNGYPRSGKDTFCKYVEEIAVASHTYSTIEPFKDLIREEFWWDGEKDDKTRRLLSDLKHLANEYCDYTMRTLDKEIKYYDSYWRNFQIDGCFFIMSREPEEIKRICDTYHALAIYVNRDIEKKFSNASDFNVENYNYDYIVNNVGTLSDLFSSAVEFCKFENIKLKGKITDQADLFGNSHIEIK